MKKSMGSKKKGKGKAKRQKKKKKKKNYGNIALVSSSI
jgi:stalled ribosome alternative rescue factor ArfA